MYTNFLITYLAIFLLVTPLTFVYAITQVFNILVLSYYLVFTNFACQSLPLFCSCFFSYSVQIICPYVASIL